MVEAAASRRQRGRPRSQGGSGEPATVQALDRALTVLTGLAQHGRSTLSDISLQLGLPNATAYRILITLQKHGYVAFDDAEQEWMVGVEAYRTGSAFLRRTTLSEVAEPILRDLMEDTGETSNLAIAHGTEVVFVAQRETANPIRAFFNPGTRTAMHASGTGKAILAQMRQAEAEALLMEAGLEQFTPHTLTQPSALFADLAQTRARGWSFDREERYEGMACVGAAIRDERGAVTGGISVSGPVARFTDATVAVFGPKVAEAARSVTRALGGVID